ncbi:unnamed protein product [Closterium sp. Naga37s-1]|nr:unnamed protein product [Closterium sp. Naga37s-1]
MLYTGYLRSLAGVMGAQGGWARRGDGRAGGMGTWDETGEGARGTVAGRGNAVHGIPVHAGGMGPPPSPCLVILTRCALSCHRLLPFRRISTASLTNFRPLLHSPPPRPNLPSALSAPRLRPRPRFLPPSAALLSLHSARPALAGSQQRKNIRRRTLHSPHSPTPSPLFPTLSPLSALPHPIPWIPSLSSLPCIPPSHSLSHPFHPSASAPTGQSLAPAALRMPPSAGWRDADGDAMPDVGSMCDVSLLHWRWRREGERVRDVWRGGRVVVRGAERERGGAGVDARCLALRLIGCLAPLAADVAHVQELVVRAAMEAEGQQEVSKGGRREGEEGKGGIRGSRSSPCGHIPLCCLCPLHPQSPFFTSIPRVFPFPASLPYSPPSLPPLFLFPPPSALFALTFLPSFD